MTTAQRYSARGGPEVEARIAHMMEQITGALADALPTDAYRSVVLMGGYGRGEGGVAVVEGEERPANNFDFLVVARHAGDAPRLKALADGALAPLVERFEMGMDVGAIGEAQLRHSPCRVMWYDLRHGHRPLLGDRELVASLDRFRVEAIEPWDVRDLLVNRGTLLLVNDLLFERGGLEEADLRVAGRHLAKAIIGYGDALLLSRGAYHYSYEERQRRMRERSDVSADLRALYDEAMELRFRPSPEPWSASELEGRRGSLRGPLAAVHLEVEAWRLGRKDLDWKDYPTIAFQHVLTEGPASMRALARRVLAVRDGAPPTALWDAGARLGWRTTPCRGRLPLVFPAVAYRSVAPSYRRLAQEALEVGAGSGLALTRAYLRRWSVHGDPNFPATVRRLRLQLDDREAA